MADEHVLIISVGGEVRDNLSRICGEYGFASVSVSDGKEIKNTDPEKKYDIIILNTPLENEFGLELAVSVSEKTGAAVIILAAQKNCDEIDRKLGSKDMYVLPKPLTKSSVIQALRFVKASRRKQSELEDENRRLQKKLHDLKQIDRAKCVLIQYLRISESDAHRQIQKRAMDQRIPEIEVAMDILRTYEM